MPSTEGLLAFFLPGLLLTIAIETPILLLGLSSRHTLREKLTAGVLLTACTYPQVVLVMPELLWLPFGYEVYIAIAETFAPLAECVIFYLLWIRPSASPASTANNLRDFAAITVANLASWLGGGLIVQRYFDPLLY
jgi:hypothetical protein